MALIAAAYQNNLSVADLLIPQSSRNGCDSPAYLALYCKSDCHSNLLLATQHGKPQRSNSILNSFLVYNIMIGRVLPHSTVKSMPRGFLNNILILFSLEYESCIILIADLVDGHAWRMSRVYKRGV